jgi:uncharacterized protein (UPF0218 family)
MKNILIIILCVTSWSTSQAQSFSGKTDNIVINVKNPPAKTDLPMIKWISPQREYTHSTAVSVDVEASVTSTVQLKSLKISVGDGTTQRSEKQFTVTANQTMKIKQPLKLLNGNNVIKITAENIHGGAVTSVRSILVGMDAIGNVVAIDRKDYILLFATDQYDHWSDLVNPIDDARSLVKVLTENYGFEAEILENPSQDEVYNKLRDYAERKFRPQDQLMIFFAGHGYFDDTFGEGFVVASNSLENDKAKTSYISHNRLRGIIQNIPCEHIFLTMDVCFGGTFDPVIASSRGLDGGETNDVEYLVRKLSQRTRKYLTSGGKEYVSDGIPGKHSPFTLKLLQALAEGGGGDRILTLSEIKTYVEKLKPEPRLGSFGDDKPESDFVFVLKN